MGVLIGSVFQFAAPGNYQKLDNVLGEKSFFRLSPGFDRVMGRVVEHQLILWEIVGGIVLLYLINRFLFKNHKKIIDSLMLILLVVAFTLNLLGIFFPYFPSRAIFFSSIALIIFVSRFVLLKDFSKLKYSVVLVFIPFFLVSTKEVVRDANKLYNQYVTRELSILEQKAQGIKNIKVKKIKRVGNRMVLDDAFLSLPDKNFWASRFYDVDSITIKK